MFNDNSENLMRIEVHANGYEVALYVDITETGLNTCWYLMGIGLTTTKHYKNNLEFGDIIILIEEIKTYLYNLIIPNKIDKFRIINQLKGIGFKKYIDPF